MEFSPTEKNIEARIIAAKESVVQDGKYPRAVRSGDLISFGLVTNEDQAEFCRELINDPNNSYGRVLVIYRNPQEKSSMVRWFARGRENLLGESFILPHIEPEESVMETFELVKGEAIFVFHSEDSANGKCRFVELRPNVPVQVLPGQIHSILCKSEVVEVVEFKLISDKKIFPEFTKKLGLIDDAGREQRGANVEDYLKGMHQRALLALESL